jgi:hypothetical protein
MRMASLSSGDMLVFPVTELIVRAIGDYSMMVNLLKQSIEKNLWNENIVEGNCKEQISNRNRHGAVK